MNEDIEKARASVKRDLEEFTNQSIIREARALAMKEEMEKAGKPAIIGSMFMKILASGDESWTINIHQIQSITPRKEGGTYIYFVGEEDALVVKHSYEEIVNQLRLSIIR